MISTVLVYRFLGSFMLPPALVRRLVRKDLEEAARHYGHDPRKIVSSSFWLSFVLGSFTLVVVFRLGSALALVASFAAAYLSFKYSAGYLSRKLRVERYTIAKHSGSVLDEFAFVLETTRSIFQAMDLVASSDYPIVSADFRRLCGRVGNGEEPEAVLLKYARRQPSAGLREGLIESISLYNSSRRELRDLATHVEREARSSFREFTLQTEARLTIFFGVLFFFPLVLAMVLVTFDLASSVLILLVVPAQILVAEALSNETLMPQVGLVG